MKHSEETKEKCRQANLGKPKTEEHKQNLKGKKDYRGDKNPNFGKKHSEETRRKISEARIKREEAKIK